MKMTDYPCLYRLADADISVQCDLFCSLSSVFGLNPSEIVEHSELFAHTSQGILFDGKGLTLKDIESFGKKRLDKPFTDCKSLSSAFSVYDLKNEACQICRLSTTYKNRWLKDEQMLKSLPDFGSLNRDVLRTTYMPPAIKHFLIRFASNRLLHMCFADIGLSL